jgi:hypothetical protein
MCILSLMWPILCSKYFTDTAPYVDKAQDFALLKEVTRVFKTDETELVPPFRSSRC